MLHLTETFSSRKPFDGGRWWSALILMALLFALAVSPMAHAQVLYGSLTGNVTDSAGASVPGAKVEAVNVSTGAAKETTTNESGVYQLNDLQAGNYRVTISLTSFKTVIKEDIKVEANMVRRFDAQLEVGDVRETVNVTADSDVLLQTDRADVNITKTDREINNLPLFG